MLASRGYSRKNAWPLALGVILIGTVACRPVKDAPIPVVARADVENTPDVINAAAFHGSWEGTLGEPLGYWLRFDCFASGGIDKVLVSISSEDRIFHFIPVDFEQTGKALRLWMNDEANRVLINLQFNHDGQLAGEFSQYGRSAIGIFNRVSGTPTDGEYHIKGFEKTVELLHGSSNFKRDDANTVVFQYEYDNPKLTELRNNFDLITIAGSGDTQSKAIKLLNWLCKGTRHYGNYDNHVEQNSLALLEYSYNQGAEKGLNCYNLSIILSEMCLSLGIQARALALMPKNPNDFDYHVVVMAWTPENGKWIMLDPSFNSYFQDANGNVLSPMELRNGIADGEFSALNPDAKIDYMEYVNYLAKDLYYFLSIQKTSFGAFSGSNQLIYLCPNGFDLVDWKIRNMRFRNSFNNQTENDLAKREEAIRQEKYIFATSESFWGK